MFNYRFGLLGKTGFPELIFHFDGANLSSNFPYEYKNGIGSISVTSNNIYNSTSQSVFGGSSAYFNGGFNSYITLTSNNANIFNLSNKDFTIQFWIRPQAQTSSYPSIFSTSAWPTYNALGIRFGCSSHVTPNAVSVVAGSAIPGDTNILISQSLSLNEWHHVAYTRAGTTHSLYINGQLSDTYIASSNDWPNLSINGNIFFGNSWDGNNGRYIGYLDDFYIINGLSLYSSNFILPDLPIGASNKININFDTNTYRYDYSNNTEDFTNISIPYSTVSSSGSVMCSTDISKGSGGRSCLIGNISDANQWLSIESPYNMAGLCMARVPFVFEFWFYSIYNDIANARILCSQKDPATGIDTEIYLYPDNQGIHLQIAGMGFDSGPATTQNTWYHILITANNQKNIEFFLNGNLIASDQHNLELDYTAPINSVPITFGGNNNSVGFIGYIDNIKFTYNSNNNYGYDSFIPPNNDDYSKLALLLHFNDNDLLDGNSSLLLHFDNNFDDESINNLYVTASGNAQLSNSQSAFGNYSVLLDGNDSFVSVPYGSWAQLGSNDFTLEGWVYPNISSNQQIFGRHIYGFAAEYVMVIDEYGNLSFYENSNPFFPQFRSSDLSVPTGTWSHVAITRENNTLRLFVNGQLGTTHNISGSLDYTDGFNDEPLSIGGPVNANGWMFNGYIDEIRLIKGLALYTKPFPLPTGAPAVSVNSRIVDYSTNDLSVNGNFSFSSGEYKFGSSSLSLNGVDEYISIDSSGISDFNFYNKDFIIESWVYPDSSVSSGAGIISTRNSSVYCPWEIQTLTPVTGVGVTIPVGVLVQSGVSSWYSGDIIQSTVPLEADRWNHMVLGMQSGNLSMIINGSGSILATGINIENTIPNSIYVGLGGENIYFSGYIDDLRIINNYCPYDVLESSNYIPVLPFQSKPLLHMHFDELPLINSIQNNNTIILESPESLNPTGLFGPCLGSSDTITIYDNLFYGGANNIQLPSILTDLTLELWIYLTDEDYLLNNHDLLWTDTVNFSVSINNGYIYINYRENPWIDFTSIPATFPISINSWIHIAITKSNDRIILYQNGSKVIDIVDMLISTEPIIKNTLYLRSLFGYIDELRFIQGALLYTNNFTPPSIVFDDM